MDKKTVRRKKLGKTTYIVESLHSSDARETLSAKITRLIKRDLTVQRDK